MRVQGSAAPHFRAAAIEKSTKNPFFLENDSSNSVKGVLCHIRTIGNMRIQCCLLLPAATAHCLPAKHPQNSNTRHSIDAYH